MAIDGSMRRRCGSAEHASAPPDAVGDPSGWISSLCEGRGGVLLVEGVPAAGKSRFARRARTSARTLPIRVLSGSGERDRQHLPFDVLLQVLTRTGEAQPVADAGLVRTLSESTEQWFWLLRAVQNRLERAALAGPLLVVIDDLQQCDAGTLLALRTLPARLSSHPILWLMTVRAGSSGADVRATVAALADAGARMVRLDRLPQDACGSAEYLMEHLSPVTRGVLRLASVLGRELEARRLADLGGRTVAEVVSSLQDAVDAGLVRPTDPLTFRNDLLREAIRETVPAPLRRAMRKHAADRSLAQGAPIGHVALAMAETAEPGDEEDAALLRDGSAELAQVSPDAAVPIARRAIALAPAGSAERAEAVADALPLLARTGRGGEALLFAETVLGGPLPAGVEARVRLEAARIAMQGAFAEALRYSRYSRAGTGPNAVPDDLRAPLRALRCLATLLTGDVPAAERLLMSSTETASRAGDGEATALLRTTDSLIQAVRSNFTAAERLAAEAVIAVPDSSALFIPAIWRATLHGMTGRVEEGLRETAEGVAAARRPGRAQGLNLWLATRARLLLAAGRPAEARAEAETALAMTEESGAGDAVSRAALSVIGRAGALTGDPAAPVPAAHAEQMPAVEAETMRRVGAWPAAPCLADPADDPSFVRAALRGGRIGLAAAAVTEAGRRAAGNPGVPLFEAVGSHVRGLLDNDVEAILRCVEILRGLHCPLPLASALEDAGRLLMEPESETAIGYLAQAEDIHVRTGAGNEAARVRRRLDAAGHRRPAKRHRRAQGWDALTPAERRVAELVAGGATNRQAAERLFLSPATVGTHVMHIFRKLDVNSRVELARAYLTHGDSAA